MDIWKIIKVDNIDINYEVSNNGNVRHIKTKRLRKFEIDKDGYAILRITLNGKHRRFRVHRLVAEAFIPNPNNLPIINHKNEIKTDNRVENLEWCTRKYNNNYGSRRLKQSTSLKGKMAGELNPFYGKKHSSKTREKISESVRKSNSFRIESLKGKGAKPLLAINLSNYSDIRYYRMVSDVKKDNFSTGAISSVCKGITSHHKGFKFFYAIDLLLVMNFLYDKKQG